MKTAVVKRHDIANAPVMRIDASFQLSEGVSVRRIIADCPYPVVKCGDVMERIWHAGRWKRVYVNNPKTGIPLVGSSAMLKSDLSDIKLISRKYTEDMADKMLHPGWILVSCSGTIGNTVFTNTGHAGKLASQHVLRLKPKDILGGWILVCVSFIEIWIRNADARNIWSSYSAYRTGKCFNNSSPGISRGNAEGD